VAGALVLVVAVVLHRFAFPRCLSVLLARGGAGNREPGLHTQGRGKAPGRPGDPCRARRAAGRRPVFSTTSASRPSMLRWRSRSSASTAALRRAPPTPAQRMFGVVVEWLERAVRVFSLVLGVGASSGREVVTPVTAHRPGRARYAARFLPVCGLRPAAEPSCCALAPAPGGAASADGRFGDRWSGHPQGARCSRARGDFRS
jgi:hypothetical protein